MVELIGGHSYDPLLSGCVTFDGVEDPGQPASITVLLYFFILIFDLLFIWFPFNVRGVAHCISAYQRPGWVFSQAVSVGHVRGSLYVRGQKSTKDCARSRYHHRKGPFCGKAWKGLEFVRRGMDKVARWYVSRSYISTSAVEEGAG